MFHIEPKRRRGLWLGAALLLLAAPLFADQARNCPSRSGSYCLSRNGVAGGGGLGSSGNYRSSGMANEIPLSTVDGSTSSSASYALGSGLMNIIAFPGKVAISSANVFVTSGTVQWVTPGYDGAVGKLLAGTTYYVWFATYSVPDSDNLSFSDANISISTKDTNPGDLARTGFAVTAVPPGWTPDVQSVYVRTLDARGNAGWMSDPWFYSNPPLHPLGVLSAITPDRSTFILDWSPTWNFQNYREFTTPITSSPTASELQGYRVVASTDMCFSDFLPLASTGVTAGLEVIVSTTYYDATYIGSSTVPYRYYQIQSYNAADSLPAVVEHNSTFDQIFLQSDCRSYFRVSNETAMALSHLTNGQGADIDLMRRFRPDGVAAEPNAGIIQSAEWIALKDNVQVSNFHFDRPATVVLHYDVDNSGAPKPLGVASARAAAGACCGSAKDLGIYWYNGAKWQKLYGDVNTGAQTVSVQTPNIGWFQIRGLMRSAGAVFDIANLSGRVITPNGDRMNDMLIFGYDPGPNKVVPTGKIYDLKGMFVSDMTPGLVPNTLTWDGRMNGRYVTGGVYVYVIKGDGKTFSGTGVVAR
ncbi:MAG: hypothetical protein NTY77_02435 [Elusimicrobia bacterium]|nr:hypothetical protein [Elusimicrobiota bacterium]